MASGKSMKATLREVVSLISPSAAEVRAENSFAASIIRRISRSCPRGYKVVLAGSVAKGTFLRDSKDLDIFVLVGKNVPKSSLESMLKRVMKKAYPEAGYQLSYAEHPYLRFHLEGRRIDLVPAYSIKHAGERLSAVDRSVLHTRFISKNLKKGRRGDVLLLKKFLKANSLYGAEIKTEGFSGYLCELLIIKYGSFAGLAKASLEWKLPLVIDLGKHYKRKTERDCLPEKFDSSFVVVDPTDKDRNVAAALSGENLKAFVRLCRRFMKSPNARMFLKEPISFSRKVSGVKGRSVYVITMPKPNVVSDVLWGQLKKLMRQLHAHMREFGPSEPFADDGAGVVIALPLEKGLLQEMMRLQGPPLDMEKHVSGFRKAHKGARLIKRKGRIFAMKKRKVRKAEEALRNFFLAYRKTESHLAYPLSKIKISKEG